MTDFHRTAIMPMLRWILLLPAISAWPGGWLLLQASLCIKPPCIYAPGRIHLGHVRGRVVSLSRGPQSPCMVPRLRRCSSSLSWCGWPHRIKKLSPGVVFIGGCAVALYLAWLTAAWGSFLAAVRQEP